MKTSDFDFQLPEELIAQTPLERRDAPRPLTLDRESGAVGHHHFYDLPRFLRPGDCLVLEDSGAGIQAAHAAGAPVVCVPDLKTPPPEVLALTAAVCPSLWEVIPFLEEKAGRGYYRPCREYDECNRLIADCFQTGRYEACFAGHLALAQEGYPLAECQVGYFYCDGLGVEKDPAKAFAWTRRAAEHGDRDGQYNLACFYEQGTGTVPDPGRARCWYARAAVQGHDLALAKCREAGITLDEQKG